MNPHMQILRWALKEYNRIHVNQGQDDDEGRKLRLRWAMRASRTLNELREKLLKTS